jgi:hypothetical protein
MMDDESGVSAGAPLTESDSELTSIATGKKIKLTGRRNAVFFRIATYSLILRRYKRPAFLQLLYLLFSWVVNSHFRLSGPKQKNCTTSRDLHAGRRRQSGCLSLRPVTFRPYLTVGLALGTTT